MDEKITNVFNTTDEVIPAVDPKIEEETEEVFNEKISLLEKIFNSTNSINPAFGGFEAIGALLALPEPQFAIMQRMVLEELQKGLSNANDRITLAEAVKASGLSVQDLAQVYSSIMDQIDEQLGSVISTTKRDFLKQVFALIVNAAADGDGLGNMVQIPIELCHSDAKMPSYANPGDAGMDIYAIDTYEILPGETKIIPTGLKVALPTGYELQMRPRSGQSVKTKLRIANSPGTIDSGYKDEIGVIVENIEPKIADISYEFDSTGNIRITSILHGKPYVIDKGQRFAQMVLNQVSTASFFKVNSVKALDEPDRGGGFGSSGK